jgi:hypothetical protein
MTCPLPYYPVEQGAKGGPEMRGRFGNYWHFATWYATCKK